MVSRSLEQDNCNGAQQAYCMSTSQHTFAPSESPFHQAGWSLLRTIAVVSNPQGSWADLDLAKLVQDGFDHAQRLVVIGTPPPDLVHPQAHEEVVNAEQKLIKVHLLQPMTVICSGSLRNSAAGEGPTDRGLQGEQELVQIQLLQLLTASCSKGWETLQHFEEAKQG